VNETNPALELDIRRNIYELVSKFAGCHFRELERKSNLATSTLRYHLHYLTKNKLISESKEGNNIRYFPKDFKANKIVLGLLRQKSIRQILLHILLNNNCNHEEIVSKVQLSPSTVSWHLKKLEENNIIGFVKDGRKTKYNLLIDKNEIINLLITYQESFLDSIVNNIIEIWDTSTF
jgi:predicted transcriptional regulator